MICYARVGLCGVGCFFIFLEGLLQINRIYNEDCLETMKRMPDNFVDLIITSPPYPGVISLWGELFKPENFEKAHEFLNTVWSECLRVLKPGAKLIINIANTKRRPYLPNTHKIYSWASGKCEPLGEIIWNKGYGQCGTAWGSYCNPSDPSLADQHEYILVFRKNGEREKQKGYFLNPKKFKSWRNSIWNIPPAKASKENHVAPFPIEIPRRLIMFYSYPEEIVYDPFLGSGTTAVACVKENRKFIGSEKEKKYCELALKKINAESIKIPLFGAG